METTANPVPVADRPAPAETPETCLTAPLPEVCALIATDCRIAPAEYLDQVRVLVGGE